LGSLGSAERAPEFVYDPAQFRDSASIRVIRVVLFLLEPARSPVVVDERQDAYHRDRQRTGRLTHRTLRSAAMRPASLLIEHALYPLEIANAEWNIRFECFGSATVWRGFT
jgi:hypothetical protein